MSNKSLINITDFSVDELSILMDIADDIDANPNSYIEACKDKKLATLFFEPSTRTRLSFESAMLDLGGNVLSVPTALSSSATKGETVTDTVKVVSNYADIIAIRHPLEGAALAAAVASDIPVINAGDGGHLHPTQTLADLLTIRRVKGSHANLTVGMCGDLKYGRTVHSLVSAMIRYENIKFVFISPSELTIPAYIKNQLVKKGIKFSETKSLEEALPALDILYMTRIQKERFDNKSEYERLKSSYILDKNKLSVAKSDMAVLHPLPRVDEIATDVDNTKFAKYFYQTLCGKQMRMALLLYLLGLTFSKKNVSSDLDPHKYFKESVLLESHCKNPRCITHALPNSSNAFYPIASKKHLYRCCYCDAETE